MCPPAADSAPAAGQLVAHAEHPRLLGDAGPGAAGSQPTRIHSAASSTALAAGHPCAYMPPAASPHKAAQPPSSGAAHAFVPQPATRLQAGGLGSSPSRMPASHAFVPPAPQRTVIAPLLSRAAGEVAGAARPPARPGSLIVSSAVSSSAASMPEPPKTEAAGLEVAHTRGRTAGSSTPAPTVTALDGRSAAEPGAMRARQPEQPASTEATLAGQPALSARRAQPALPHSEAPPDARCAVEDTHAVGSLHAPGVLRPLSAGSRTGEGVLPADVLPHEGRQQQPADCASAAAQAPAENLDADPAAPSPADAVRAARCAGPNASLLLPNVAAPAQEGNIAEAPPSRPQPGKEPAFRRALQALLRPSRLGRASAAEAEAPQLDEAEPQADEAEPQAADPEKAGGPEGGSGMDGAGQPSIRKPAAAAPDRPHARPREATGAAKHRPAFLQALQALQPAEQQLHAPDAGVAPQLPDDAATAALSDGRTRRPSLEASTGGALGRSAAGKDPQGGSTTTQGQAEAPASGDEGPRHQAVQTAAAEHLGGHAALPGSLSNADELAGHNEVVLGSLPSRHPRQRLEFLVSRMCLSVAIGPCSGQVPQSTSGLPCTGGAEPGASASGRHAAGGTVCACVGRGSWQRAACPAVGQAAGPARLLHLHEGRR